ncbi:hypothetical protein LPJ59_002289 [Coemansia sp. RSA 2399]|nr:hypothetical protein LPJ59_002289 [Coemansia sp. RSA 2399]KAJ1905393.1 hypothetical protein LPJ81_001952 [Coemansia sp. IMI 209127]
MVRILKKRALGSGSSTAGHSATGGTNVTTAQSVGARHSLSAVRDETGGRQKNVPQTTTDILSHLQELKDKEKQVLGRTNREAQLPSTSGAGGSASVEEAKSRQERLAREERMANQYREQLKTKLQDIDNSSIDLAAQKATMTQFECQLLGSSSPRELEQLELERINGIRSLIGLPVLPPLSVVPASGSGAGSVRQSRPGTPLYFSPSPSHKPSAGTQYRTSSRHQRASSFGDNARYGSGLAHRRNSPGSGTAHNGHPGAGSVDGGDDDEVQDMDLDLEEGEVAEEGELLE